MGKSSFGNLYLQDNVFEANDSTEPVTQEAIDKSKVIDNCTRWVTDAEGLNDGESINSIQNQNFAKLMRNYERGVNAVVAVLNGQYQVYL
ncbi:hypothetical protein M9Y10_006677 [Tritrichomonas musculus]|uniref:AIG1-type G domain-containing protein n=1 Tax=Tritrichomonas musculus TaxID=1915356 RepID=A0ABR2JFD3_9EUKA